MSAVAIDAYRNPPFGGGQEIAYAYASSPLNNVTLPLNLLLSDKAKEKKDFLWCECKGGDGD